MKRLLSIMALMILTLAVILTLGSCGKKHEEHTPGKAVRENEISADCVTDGSYDEVVYCTECGEEISRTKKTAMKIGHSLSEFTSDKNATCTRDGTRSRSCTNAGCDYAETEVELYSATGHTAGALDFGGEYCGKNPVASVYCEVCGEYVTSYGHSYDKVTTPATCDTEGMHVYTCTLCGDSYTERFAAFGHISGPWVTVLAPTCSATGRAEKECLVCGQHYESKVLATLPHTYTSKLTSEGLLYTCSECGYSYTEAVNAPVYTITFNECGGKDVEDIAVLEHAVPEMPIAVREGYIFIGWFIDEALTEIYTGSNVESDLTLYAGWGKPEIIEDEQDIVSGAPLNYTFGVISSTALTNENIGKYVSIKTLGGSEINPKVVSQSGNVYTIGADYKSGESYFVTLNGISFESNKSSELWIKTEGEKQNSILLKSGVKPVSIDQLFGIYDNEGELVLIAYKDILAVGDLCAFYEGAEDAYRFGAKIIAKSNISGYTAYTAEMLTVDQVFEVCDLGESDKVDFNNAEISSTLTEELAAAFRESPVYSQFSSTIKLMANSTKADVKAIDFNVSFSAKGEKFFIKFHAQAALDSGVEFIMNYIVELDMDFDFALSGEKSTVILNTNMKNTVELNVVLSGNELHGATVFNKASLLSEYKKLFNEINERNMKISESSDSTGLERKSIKLATVPMEAGPVTAYVTIMGEFGFEMVGGLSAELVQTVNTTIGLRDGKFVKDYKAKLVSVGGCVYTVTDLYGGIAVKLDVGFCGLYGYIKGSIGIQGEISGAAAFAIKNNTSFLLGNYHFTSEVVMDVRVGVNYIVRVFGCEKVLFDKSIVIAEKGVPFITLGDKKLALHFVKDDYTTSDDPIDLGAIICGKHDVSSKIDTSVLVIDANTLKPTTKALNCEYVVKVTSGSVKATVSGKGVLNISGSGSFTLAVTVKYGDVVEKTVYIKGDIAHKYDDDGFCICGAETKFFEPIFSLSSDGNSYTVTGYRGTAIDVVIPSTYNGKPVTAIGYKAFYDCSTLTGIVIPDSVTSIGAEAFYNCNLTSITLPFTGEAKGDPHFAKLGYIFGSYYDNSFVPSSLKTVILTGGTKIHASAFSGCAGITSIAIPDSVTGIGDSAFEGCSSLTDVSIPAGVTSIGARAFNGCSGLTSIVIPDGVTSIADTLFANCTSLTSVAIHEGVLHISDFAFSYCTSLTSIKYGGSESQWKAISKGTNWDTGTGSYTITYGKVDEPVGTEGLKYTLQSDGTYYVTRYIGTATEVVIPSTYEGKAVTGIGGSAFRFCNTITAVTIPDSVTSIGDVAFYYCESLTSVTIPDSVTSIGYSAFSNCTNLASIVISDNVTSIGNYAFQSCKKLTGIVIPDSVTSIGSYAFQNCTSLAKIVIGDSVISIGERAFQDCTSLKDVYYTGTVDQWCNISFSYYSYPMYNGANLYIGGELVTELVIPGTVTEIKDYAFYGCASLTSIVIPDSVTSIGSYAFNSCSALTSVVIGDSVISIGNNAFWNCTSLSSAVIGDSVTSIGSDAFAGCTSLTSIEIPDSVTSIGERGFASCTGLTSIKYGGTEAQWKAISKGANWDHKTDNYTITYGKVDEPVGAEGLKYTLQSNDTYSVTDYTGTATEVVIPSTYEGKAVTGIGYEAFRDCTSLTSVVIPNSVTIIGSDAFAGCTSLTSIEIPDSVTSIGRYAFYSCTSLTSIVIPDSVTWIGDYAFHNCKGLTSITLPFVGTTKDGTSNTHFGYIFGAYSSSYNSSFVPSMLKTVVITSGTRIDNNAFYGCSTLTSIAIPNSVTSICGSAFENCTSLTSIEIPDSVTSIGDFAFRDCTSLTSVEIPDSVTSIGNAAFYGCYSLTSINIPDSVTSIGSYTLYGCYSLTSIVIPDSVTSIGEWAFYGCTGLTSIKYRGTYAMWAAVTKGTRWDNYYDYKGASYATINYTLTVNYSDDPTDTERFVYTLLNDGTYSVDGYVGTATDIAVPSTYNGKAVSRIGDYAFFKLAHIESVVIPEGIMSIGRSAFDNCLNLTEVKLPDGVESLGYCAFYGCTNLASIVIPDSVTSIGKQAFYGCTSLTSIEIPDSVTSIGDYAFYNCTSLTSIELPDSVTSIGGWAFYNCKSLTSIKYGGTESQWKAISKGASWNFNTGNYTITYNYDGN